MNTQNDRSAKYYDEANKLLKGFDVIVEEINLITSLTKPNSKILDIGCGTGRHLIYLHELGYNITGVDNSSQMLEVLKGKLKKNSKIKLINSNFFDIDPQKLGEFDLIILMWNTFNEIVLIDVDAEAFFEKIKKLLKNNSKVLINIDNADYLNPANLNFSVGNDEVKQEWSVESFDEKTNTTISNEKIIVNNNEEIISKITQRWWKLSEIMSLAEKFNFKITQKRISLNDELYLILEK